MPPEYTIALFIYLYHDKRENIIQIVHYMFIYFNINYRVSLIGFQALEI